MTRHHALCDKCDCHIEGIRWKCINCADFDFCDRCYHGVRDPHPPRHLFMKIFFPLPPNSPRFYLNQLSFLSDPIELMVSPSSSCTSLIFPSSSSTPFFSTSSSSSTSCNSSTSTSSTSTSSTSTSSTSPLSTTSSTRCFSSVSSFCLEDDKEEEEQTIEFAYLHSYTICDGCEMVIVGHRYRCLHCDYDLCEKCEQLRSQWINQPAGRHSYRTANPRSQPVTDHSPLHVFLRVEHPLATSLPFFPCLSYPHQFLNAVQKRFSSSSLTTSSSSSSSSFFSFISSPFSSLSSSSSSSSSFSSSSSLSSSSSSSSSSSVSICSAPPKPNRAARYTRLRDARWEDLEQIATLDLLCFQEAAFSLKSFQQLLHRRNYALGVAVVHKEEQQKGSNEPHKQEREEHQQENGGDQSDPSHSDEDEEYRHDEEMVGYVLLKYVERTKRCELQSLAVHPDKQGLGIGRLLFDTALKQCRSTPATTVTLHVAVSNLKAQALYVSRGFQTLDWVPGYYQTPSPGGSDALFMSLPLC